VSAMTRRLHIVLHRRTSSATPRHAREIVEEMRAL
jgi:hypothetical protein